MKLLKIILILTEMVCHMGKYIFSKLVNERPLKFDKIKDKIDPNNFKNKINTPKHFRNYQIS